MPGFRGELREVEAGTQRRGETHNGQTPQGITGTWVQAKGSKGGSALSRKTVADTGTRRGEQGRAAEAGKLQVAGSGGVQVGCALH